MDPWKLSSDVAFHVASLAANQTMPRLWRAVTGRQEPSDPKNLDAKLGETILYAAFSGAIAALAQVLAVRGAARLYIRRGGAPERLHQSA